MMAEKASRSSGVKRLAGRFGLGPGTLLGSIAPQQYQDQLSSVDAAGKRIHSYNDEDLRREVDVIKERIGQGSPAGTIIHTFFAIVREVAQRTIGLRPYDVQIIGGLGLYEGKIVQMETGEGKTLAAVAPIAMHALSGSGAHVLTFNDYLARRDAEWMGPIYRFLGLSVATIQEGLSYQERRLAYQADVTYLTAKEAGFDYLRDGLAFETGELVQRPFHAAVVDEADSILIDEARVPLVIAGTTERILGQQQLMRTIVKQLLPHVHYAVDEFGRNVYLTEAGSIQAEKLLGRGDLFSPVLLQLLTELNLALHAEALMKRDIDYIVRDGRVEIVDDFTGRVVQDRHWPHGLQTAIETKEGLSSSEEGRILGSITLQHFLRNYPHLSGMTATAESAEDELYQFYGLEITKVPPNRPCVRVDQPDHVFPHQLARNQALVREIGAIHQTGRPILVGTTSVAASELLAASLIEAGINCQVLNARNDHQEAGIIAEAGAIGSVTISTNMAGRGTDIRLGGRDGADNEQVAGLGGLYVIGTNRHESRRIDDQLRGRAGRQGDPGSSRFFVSLDDEVLARHKIADSLPKRFRAAASTEPVDSPLLRRQVDRAQTIAESQNFEIRQTLWRYSRFVEGQRRIIAERRRGLLDGIIDPIIFSQDRPAEHQRLHKMLGEEILLDLERRVLLQAIDDCWSEHLATVNEIRDGIHLAEIGGLDPFREFLKLGAAAFDSILTEIDEGAFEKYDALQIGQDGVDFELLGLQGPSSTWTYLVNDQGFSDRFTAQLIGSRNVGFAAMAAFTGPLLMVWALTRRLKRE